ncbi:PAS domain-containing sensor histidine kinase [bacterium]|nr:MAG: PAS domain-containing sensor histidine kinase [bacterium]
MFRCLQLSEFQKIPIKNYLDKERDILFEVNRWLDGNDMYYVLIPVSTIGTSTDDTIYLLNTDLDGALIHWNEAFYSQFLGDKKEKLQSVFSFFAPKDLETIKKSLKELSHNTGHVIQIHAPMELNDTQYHTLWNIAVNHNEQSNEKTLIWRGIKLKDKKETVNLLENLSKSFAHLSGKEFFDAICKQVAYSLGLDIVFVGSLRSDEEVEQVDVIGGFDNGKAIIPFSYGLKDTPCAHVAGRDFKLFSNNVQQIFENDELLKQLEIEAYVGLPIFSKDRKPLGIFVGLKKTPIQNTDFIYWVFNSFADRISAEMQRFQFESNLIETQRIINTIINSTGDGIVLFNQKGKIKFLNDFAKQFFESSFKDKIEAINPLERVVALSSEGQELPKSEYPINITFRTGNPVINQVIGIKLEKGIYWVSVNTYPIFLGENTKPHEVVLTFRDISDIEKSSKMYLSVIQTSIDGFWILDMNANLINTNEAYSQIIGYSREELLRMNISDVEVNESHNETLRHIELVKKQGTHKFETRHKTKKGEIIDVEVNAKYIEHPTSYVVAFIRDISDLKSSERKLVESEDKYHTLFDTMPNGYYLTTPEGKLIEANPAFCKMLGYDSVQELRELDIKAALYVKESDRLNIATKNSEFLAKEEVYQLKRKDGSIIWVEDNARYIKNEHNEVIFHEGICRDVTDRFLAEEELHKKNKELDRFVYSTSHDLRAPLASILGLVDLAKITFIDYNQEQREIFEMMERSVNKLDVFIKEILTYSRNQHIDVKSDLIDIHSLLESQIQALNFEKKSIIIQKNIIQNEDLYSDKFRVSVILNNLIGNSIKYSDANKTECIIQIHVLIENGEFHLTVRDNGIGIEESQINKIFEMFYRASENSEGTGLGLYIVKEMLEQLRAKVEVKSELGVGSTFHVIIPNGRMK